MCCQSSEVFKKKYGNMLSHNIMLSGIIVSYSMLSADTTVLSDTVT
jgi:hypothetical protein